TGKGHPTTTSIVEVNYTGWTTDGNMFDSSVKRNKPMRFATTQVIPGWTEGRQLMSPGEKTRFWIPVELAYNNAPGKPAGMLVFDVALLDIKKRRMAPQFGMPGGMPPGHPPMPGQRPPGAPPPGAHTPPAQ